MATHSSVLAWRIAGTGEPGGLPSMGSHRVGHDWSDLAAAAAAAVTKKTWHYIILEKKGLFLIKYLLKWLSILKKIPISGRFFTNWATREALHNEWK